MEFRRLCGRRRRCSRICVTFIRAALDRVNLDFLTILQIPLPPGLLCGVCRYHENITIINLEPPKVCMEPCRMLASACQGDCAALVLPSFSLPVERSLYLLRT